MKIFIPLTIKYSTIYIDNANKRKQYGKLQK